MFHINNFKFLTLISGISVALSLVACGPSGQNPPSAEPGVATDSPAAASEQITEVIEPGGRWMLRDHNNQIVTDQDFQGQFLLISFGYTTCPDICPTTLMKLAEVKSTLGETANDLQFLFVTVDPDRDTTDILREYVTSFDPGFIGLTGSHAVIQSITKKYRVKYAYPGKDSPEDMDYSVDHTSTIFFMGDDGTFIRRFTFPTQADEIALEVSKIMREVLEN